MHENLNMVNHDRYVLDDLKEIARQLVSGRTRDRELIRRVRERAQHAREELHRTLGVQEIGVSIIREMRDAE
jgi:hypothetical protein